MKRVLSICDSIANTRYSAQLCVDTFSDYNVEPMLAVPEFTDGDNIEQTDIKEVLDYCLKLDLNAVHIGMIRDPEAVNIVADGLSKYDHPAVVCEPSIISADGRILVSVDTYEAFTNSLIQQVHFLILNIYEAELFSGVECHGPADARKAADLICEDYHCVVFVGGCKKTLGRDLLVIGGKAKWYEGSTSRSIKNKKHFAAAVACELASDKPIGDAVTAARYFCGITSGADVETDQTFEYIPARPETPKKAAKPVVSEPAVAEPAPQVLDQFEVLKNGIPEPSAVPEPEVKTEITAEIKTEDKPLFPEGSILSSATPVSSLVSPAKSIRDAARTLEPVPSRIKFGSSGIYIPSDGILARELAKKSPKGSITAVTSGIEAKEEEKPEAPKTEESSDDSGFNFRRLFEL